MVCVSDREILVDLIELDIVAFDIILGMDWLQSCYATLDCGTHTITFKFLNKLVIE